jgi:hypothetical protein
LEVARRDFGIDLRRGDLPPPCAVRVPHPIYALRARRLGNRISNNELSGFGGFRILGVATAHWTKDVGRRRAARPSLLQPQTLVTATIVGILVGLVVWLVGGRPLVGPPARAAISTLLIVGTIVAATSPGGAVIYAAPVLIPLFWWMAYQGNLPARIAWAILASVVAVEALALATYGSSGFGITAGLFIVGLSSGLAVLTANRCRAVRHREFPNF